MLTLLIAPGSNNVNVPTSSDAEAASGTTSSSSATTSKSAGTKQVIVAFPAVALGLFAVLAGFAM